MRIKILTLCSVAIIFVSSCNENSDTTDKCTGGIVPLQFTATVGEMQMSRVGMQDDKIAIGQRVWMWIDNADDGTKHIGAWQHASDGTGKLNPIPFITKYFPAGNLPVDIYGVHGNFFVTPDSNKPDTITHSVYTNQISSSNYLVSDLLWVNDLNHQAKDSIKLKFRHMLSKIEICFQPVGSVTDAMIAGATAEVVNVPKNVKLALADGGGLSYGSLSNIEFPLHTIPASATSFSGATYAEIVVPPHQVKTSQNLIRLTCTNGDTYYYRPDSTFIMEPGKVYRFNMFVKQTIKIDPGSLNPWTPESKNIEYDIVPMVIEPDVYDWNPESVDIEWKYENIEPEVSDWIPEDGGSFSWNRITPVPEVLDWNPEDGFNYSWSGTDVSSGATQNPQP
jgi:hypothetical protein